MICVGFRVIWDVWGKLENPVTKDVLDPKVETNPTSTKTFKHISRILSLIPSLIYNGAGWCVKFLCSSGDKGESVGCSGPPGDKGPPGDFGPSGDDLVLVPRQ